MFAPECGFQPTTAPLYARRAWSSSLSSYSAKATVIPIIALAPIIIRPKWRVNEAENA